MAQTPTKTKTVKPAPPPKPKKPLKGKPQAEQTPTKAKNANVPFLARLAHWKTIVGALLGFAALNTLAIVFSAGLVQLCAIVLPGAPQQCVTLSITDVGFLLSHATHLGLAVTVISATGAAGGGIYGFTLTAKPKSKGPSQSE